MGANESVVAGLRGSQAEAAAREIVAGKGANLDALALSESVAHRSANVRKILLQRVAALKPDAAIPALRARAFDDADDDVSGTAAELLTKFHGKDEGMAALIDMILTSRGRTSRRSGNRPETSWNRARQHAFAHVAKKVKKHLALASHRPFLEEVEYELSDARQLESRVLAAKLLGDLNARMSVHALLRALDDATIRVEAAKALAVLGVPEAMPAFQDTRAKIKGESDLAEFDKVVRALKKKLAAARAG